MDPRLHRTFTTTHTPLPSAAEALFKGIVMTFIMQATITTALGLIHTTFEHDWWLEKALLTSFVVTSGNGFYLLVRGCRPIEKVLVAFGYFPMMLFGYWLSALYILLSLPGVHDSL